MTDPRHHEAWFAGLVAALPVGLATVGSDARIRWANRTWPSLSRTESEGSGGFVDDVLGVGDEESRQTLRRWIRDGTAGVLRSVRLARPGSRSGPHVDVEVRLMPPIGPDSDRLVIVHDVTDRALEHERAVLFYKSFLTSTNAIEITDAKGVLVDVNPAFERIYGYSREECIGRKPNLVRSKATPVEVYAQLWAELLDPNRGYWSGEILNRDRWGHERPVMLTITAVRDSHGRATHYIGVAVDLTERRIWERTAAHADRLASIGRLAAGVAHEINTPLTNVMLVAESVRQRTEDPWVRSRIDTITQQVDVAARIVRGLLDFARRSEPQITHLDLNDVARNAVEFVRGKQSTNVEVEEVYPASPILVAGDRGQLNQVLTNLLNNGYEALEGSESGRLRLEVRRVGSSAEIEVADSGPGIPLEALPHLFEPFFTTKLEGKGTGLGLAICDGLVHAHHGEITAGNRPEGGACFVVRLPLAQPVPSGSSGGIDSSAVTD